MSYIPSAQARQVMVGSFQPATGVLTPTAQTNSYVASAGIKVQNMNQAVLYIAATLGSATSFEIQVDVANPPDGAQAWIDATPAGADWYPVCFIDSAAATGSAGSKQVPVRSREYQLLASGNYAIELPVSAKWMRVRTKCTGVITGATLSVIGQEGLA